MATRSVSTLDCTGTRVLIRVDFNVPLDDAGHIMDDRRIRMALPTIRRVVDDGGVAVVMSHLGRPSGTGPEEAWSLAPVAQRLGELLGENHRVHFVAGDCTSPDAARAVSEAAAGEVVLLDNLRFHAGEKGNDPAFSRALASLGDAYVNDAFGTAHRDHASMLGVPEAMSDAPRVAGLLLARELEFLTETLAHAERPFVAILGGAKVSDKLGAIRNLLPRVDAVLVGGGMAYTFLKARGESIGRSLLEEDMIDTAAELIEQADREQTALHCPTDHVCASALEPGVETTVCTGGVDDGLKGLDIGPDTVRRWCELLATSRTVVWNGPVGVFEVPPFDAGTMALASTLGASDSITSIVGGGETAAAVERAGVARAITHVSTGGGASLRLLEGASFASVLALERD